MGNFNKIKSNIEQLESMIAELETKKKSLTEDFAIDLELTSLNNQLDDLREQLYRANLKREKEIIELRLIGQTASFGSIPLEFVGGLTNNFSRAIFNTSKFIKYGSKGGKRREKLIEQTIDLRFEGVGRGSTIFYLSGKTNPDLFGNSIIQKALENTFDLFNSEEPDEMVEKVGDIGPSSVKFISRFLNELSNDNLNIDIKWQSPDNKEFTWKGNSENITRLYNSLNQMDISKPEDFEFEGELITISSKGKFELLTKEDKHIIGKFSDDLLEKMKEFHIGDECKGVISKVTIYNPLTDKEKIEYNLKKIK